LKANAALANAIVKSVAASLPHESSSPALHAARHAIMTTPALIPAATKERLALLYGAYLGV
ncbi:MAG: S-methyl-5'-thioadenosine phosphorylase, partial [Proteobacteria bacterium]|nr:S-methyl-5'-thioadenosine phosphorylase [Pseudomonadota bacterium]